VRLFATPQTHPLQFAGHQGDSVNSSIAGGIAGFMRNDRQSQPPSLKMGWICLMSLTIAGFRLTRLQVQPVPRAS